jgi:DtxR family Mn-dependent transcriptional regulator
MEKVTSSLEDYLEAIYQICQESQVARVKEIAERMKVTDASVVGALKVLRKKRLIEQERYGYIRLTGAGEAMARDVFGRHEALARFFNEVLGLGEKAADEEACRAEHCLEDKTVGRLALLQKFLGHKMKKTDRLLGEFGEFVKRKGM